MKKKVISLLVAASMVMSMFAGCGAKEEKQVDAAPETAAEDEVK